MDVEKEPPVPQALHDWIAEIPHSSKAQSDEPDL
jgi:hypothetical protein